MDDSSTTALTPFVFDTIQNTYVSKLSHIFVTINHDAMALFYILATLEIAFFGIIWALKQQEMVGPFLFKIIKLGVIFFLISNYTTLLNVLLNGFTQLGFSGLSNKAIATLFGPDLLWKYGFNSGISLLSLGVQYGSANFGMAGIDLFMGFGILILFSLIACQIILLVVGFYVVSLLALLLLPFGTFVMTESLFHRSIHGVIKAAVKIFALVLIVGIGVGIWSSMSPAAFTASTTLDQPLGLLFTTLIITILAWKVPAMLADAVGEVGGQLLFNSASGSSISQGSAAAPSTTVVSNAVSQVAAASNISAAGAASAVSQSAGATSTSTSTTPTGAPGATAPGLSGLNRSVSDLTKAVKVQREGGISRDTLNKLKSTFKEALNQQK